MEKVWYKFKSVEARGQFRTHLVGNSGIEQYITKNYPNGEFPLVRGQQGQWWVGFLGNKPVESNDMIFSSSEVTKFLELVAPKRTVRSSKKESKGSRKTNRVGIYFADGTDVVINNADSMIISGNVFSYKATQVVFVNEYVTKTVTQVGNIPLDKIDLIIVDGKDGYLSGNVEIYAGEIQGIHHCRGMGKDLYSDIFPIKLEK